MDIHSNDDSSIAIVGMAGRFPGAKDINAFWTNLKAGTESIRFFTDDELRGSPYVRASELADVNYVKARGTLDGFDLFDAEFFGISPREAEIMDPQLRVFLECAFHALEDAGYNPFAHAAPIGIFAGASTSTYLLQMLKDMPRGVSNELQLLLYNSGNCLATYTSYKLGLKGPSVNVQTACSTSLVAVHLACQSLLSGECDAAMAGGVSIDVRQPSGYLYEPSGIASPDGHCKAFDEAAAGCVAGSGVGVVVLKRLPEAIADRDHIYAVIKASAINNDGATKIGFTAPSIQGQSNVIALALSLANVDPSTIAYVECHGTGTRLGDPIEVSALSQALRTDADEHGVCAIGSAKANIGHLDAAAGVASLIKAALAVKHGQIPPSVNYRQPNPNFDLARSPLYVNTQLREWPSDREVRRAGVSSFGIGGTNAHVILEQAPALVPEGPSARFHLIPLSARTPVALQRLCANVGSFLDRHSDIDLANVAYTCQVGRAAWEYRSYITAATVEEARRLLESPPTPQRPTADRSVVFMFPGQGTQYPAMAAGLYRDDAVFRGYVDSCMTTLTRCATPGTVDILRGSFAGVVNPLHDTAAIQVALFVVEYALAKTVMEYGVQPSAMIGHSLGEYVTACLAGVMTLEQGLALIAQRSRLIQALPKGVMLAALLPEQRLRELLPDQVSMAAVNAGSLCVASGPLEGIEKLASALKAEGVGHHRLAVSHAFHSSMMEPAVEPYRRCLAEIDWQSPRIPYISNVTGTWISEGDLAPPSDYWIRHLCMTVRYADGLSEVLRQPGILVELGPGSTLSGLAKQHPSYNGTHVLVKGLRRSEEKSDDLRVLCDCLGLLWSNGIDIAWQKYQAGCLPRRLSIPTYPFERKRYWIGNDSSETPTTELTPSLDGGRHTDVSKWFYSPRWKQLMPARPTSSATHQDERAVLVLGGDDNARGADRGDLSSIATLLWGRTDHDKPPLVFSVNVDKPDECDRLFQELSGQPNPIGGIIYIPRSAAGAERASDADRITRDCSSLLAIVKAYNGSYPDVPVRLCVVTQTAFGVTGLEPAVDPAAAALIGFCRVIAQEFPHVASRVIDVDSATWNDCLAMVRSEMSSDTDEILVAYRSGRRWGMVYDSLPVPPAAPHRSLLKHRGTYVITGGLGNIGLLFAQHLAQHACANLVLVGSSAFPDRDEWEAILAREEADPALKAKLQTLRRLESFGARLDVVQADVANHMQMRMLVTHVLVKFGALDGVVHCAGYMKPDGLRPLHQTDGALLALQLAPKVMGVQAIEHAVSHVKPDFCLLVSSIATVLGGVGYGAYAAANCYLDAFAAKKDTQPDGTVWISVGFDGWRFGDTSQSGGDRYRQLAALAITPQEGERVIETLFSIESDGRLIVSTADLRHRIQALRTVDSKASVTHRSANGYHPRPPLAVAYTAPRNEVEKSVVEILEHVLHISGIGVDDGFFELGGNSLLGIQVLSHVKKKFDIEIPVRLMFEHPTPSQLASVIEQKMIDDIDQLSEEEAAVLLNDTTADG